MSLPLINPILIRQNGYYKYTHTVEFVKPSNVQIFFPLNTSILNQNQNDQNDKNQNDQNQNQNDKKP